MFLFENDFERKIPPTQEKKFKKNNEAYHKRRINKGICTMPRLNDI